MASHTASPKPRRIGEILLERGWITHEQLFRALEKQQHARGRLGTALVEIDALSEEQLQQALSEQQRVPYAGIDELRNVPPEVVALVPARIAVRCRAIPFRVALTQVHVAMMDVKNLAFQDELAFVTAKRIKIYICSEARIFEALEKFYGHQCSSRYVNLLDRLNRARYLWDRGVEIPNPSSEDSGMFVSIDKVLGREVQKPTQTASATAMAVAPDPTPVPTPVPVPPPVAPPEFETRVGRPPVMGTPAPVTFSDKPGSIADITLVATAPEAASPPAAPAPTTLSSAPPVAPARPVPAAAAPVPAKAAPPKVEPPRVEPSPPAPVPTPPPAPPQPEMTSAELESRLLSPKDRDDVGQALVQYLSQSFTRVALLVVRKTEIAGWMGAGNGLDQKALESFQTDLAKPSVFVSLVQRGDYFLGALPPLPVHRDLARAWGGEMPRECLVLPIRLKGRLVAMIYADRGAAGLGELDLDELKRLAAKATIAFELCIMRNKLRNA